MLLLIHRVLNIIKGVITMIKQVKKSKKGITPFFKVLILNIILLPSIVLADNIYMTCDQDNVTKNNLSCSIKGNTTKEIIAISLKVQTGNNLSFSKFIPSTVWQGDGEEGNVDLYTANDILGKYDIGTLNINVESSYQGILRCISHASDFRNGVAEIAQRCARNRFPRQ